MLTCSRFRPIAKRQFIRIVHLPNADRLNAFADYLETQTTNHAYGTAILPVQHLAVFGQYFIPEGRCASPDYTETDIKAKTTIVSLITKLAPSLRSLVVFGHDV